MFERGERNVSLINRVKLARGLQVNPVKLMEAFSQLVLLDSPSRFLHSRITAEQELGNRFFPRLVHWAALSPKEGYQFTWSVLLEKVKAHSDELLVPLVVQFTHRNHRATPL